jgi:SAM-dependent methyltransferase
MLAAVDGAPRWTLDELAHAGQEHLDADYVATYDRKSGPYFDAAEEVDLLLRNGVDEKSTVVDLGAGTGAFALAAAPHCRRVVAVDVSPKMLATLRAKAERRGVANVECVQAGFLGYAHAGEPADAVHSRNALHHLPDFWKAVALDRIAALVRSGGLLRLRDLVFSFDPDEAGPIIEAWLARAPKRPEEGWTRSELEEHVREEHSTFSWLLEPMLERAGFAIRDASYSETRTYAAYLCTKL